MTSGILNQIHHERRKQDEKWGVQNLLDLSDPFKESARLFFGQMADTYKDQNDDPAEDCELDWTGVLLEEVYEALAESDPLNIRAELIQVAAVAVAWIEHIDRRAYGEIAAA